MPSNCLEKRDTLTQRDPIHDGGPGEGPMPVQIGIDYRNWTWLLDPNRFPVPPSVLGTREGAIMEKRGTRVSAALSLRASLSERGLKSRPGVREKRPARVDLLANKVAREPSG